jgi:hypothetical protein
MPVTKENSRQWCQWIACRSVNPRSSRRVPERAGSHTPAGVEERGIEPAGPDPVRVQENAELGPLQYKHD